MQSPGGTNHHQAPSVIACAFWAKNRMLPQLLPPGAPRPRNDSPASARIAPSAPKTNCDAMIGIRLGRISRSMIRQFDSLATRAAST